MIKIMRVAGILLVGFLLIAGSAVAVTAQTAETGGCIEGQPPTVRTGIQPGGFLDINVSAPCLAGRGFEVRYGPYAFTSRFDERGQASYRLDLFLGTTAKISVVLEDGAKLPVNAPDFDFGHLSKVALVWKADVNLDLHALEYLATPATEGHIWPANPSSFEKAFEASMKDKGRGFLSTIMRGDQAGDKVDVYTFISAIEQRPGVVSLFVDFETRGSEKRADTCGEGENASVTFEIVQFVKGETITRQRIAIAPLSCDAELGGALALFPLWYQGSTDPLKQATLLKSVQGSDL